MSKKLMIVLAVLLVVTCGVAVIHLNQQQEISCMVIKTSTEEIQIDFSDLDKESFSGQLTDGKGETASHTYKGVLLRDLLSEKNITVEETSSVVITSADNYSVTFTGSEVLEDGKIYAAIEADGVTIEGIDPGTEGVQIIVFGDENSRRCVRFAAVMEVC